MKQVVKQEWLLNVGKRNVYKLGHRRLVLPLPGVERRAHYQEEKMDFSIEIVKMPIMLKRKNIVAPKMQRLQNVRE